MASEHNTINRVACMVPEDAWAFSQGHEYNYNNDVMQLRSGFEIKIITRKKNDDQ